MSIFSYQAYNNDGKKVEGALEGDSAKRVREALRLQGLTPISVTMQAAHEEKSTSRWQFRKSITISDLNLMTRELSALIGAGLPVEEALGTLSKQVEKSNLKNIILNVRDQVREGYSLAKSMQSYPNYFPDIFTATIAAGEESGHLTEVLEHLADYTERQELVHNKIKQALIYPGLMTLVAVSVIVFLLIVIVPTLVNVFQSSHAELPMMTKILIASSDALTHYGLYILILLILGMYGFKRVLKNPIYHKKYQSYLMRLPLIGKTLITSNTARFARTLGILLQAGVPMLHALDISTQLITLIPLREKLVIANNHITEGLSLHLALEKTGYFSPLMIHFVANGEATGKLDDMLTRAAVNQERKVMSLIDSVLTLFEPFLILLMGGVVLFIVLAVLIPLFQITQLVA